ncbi:lariat debranching enzyme, C-terminal domain-containing protein [Spinellus fusiger]|nr:lariat debranching enzyme, C-terminal domain-containing protein [Spinellus fusiger]
MKIAIEGCCHGQLDKIYGSIRLLEKRGNYKVDLVLICGDFQAIRNTFDLNSMAVPDKYKEMGTFWKYYSGAVKPPYPTIFIGGNHEASNYLWELYHGGWVSKDIYYLGNAGVINFNGVRIGGISGIYKSGDYKKGHYESAPYSPSDMRSVYHVREYDVKKLMRIQKPMDIFLSHDWPRGIERFGNMKKLIKKKPYFQQEIMTNSLGSPANEDLLKKLQPSLWFSAHLHVYYSSLVDHDKLQAMEYSKEVNKILRINPKSPARIIEKVENPDEIAIDLSEEEEEEEEEKKNTPPEDISISLETEVTQTASGPKITKFLSLDKCLPYRDFLQVIDVPTEGEPQGFTYDLEWLAITRSMHPYMSLGRSQNILPSDEALQASIQAEMRALETRVESGELDLKIPDNFSPTAPAYQPDSPQQKNKDFSHQPVFLNPQTSAFCDRINIENKINVTSYSSMDNSSYQQKTPSPEKEAQVIANGSRIQDPTVRATSPLREADVAALAPTFQEPKRQKTIDENE